jgi:two-component system, sensor histidine kinase
MKYRGGSWFRNISIKRKLYFVIGIMALLIAVELFTLWFSVKTLSTVRAYVGGESLWSKAQKDAGYYLEKYGCTHNEKDYTRFREFLKVPSGDAKARTELLKKDPDDKIVRQGLLEGRNHVDDVEGMIWLFRNFSTVSYIDKAFKIWNTGEPLIQQYIPIGERIHDEINSGSASQDKINNLLSEIDEINVKLTKLEDDFSFTLGEGSRWLETLILKILFVIVITVELTSLLLTVSVSMTLSRGINEVVRVSKKVSEGNFEESAKIYSKDEIGYLAESFNTMIADLKEGTRERKLAEEKLLSQNAVLEKYSTQLEQSNRDLERFAYVASHDLREPLRTVTSYAQIIEKRYREKLDHDADVYIGYIVEGVKRMDMLITDILHYSRLNNMENTSEEINCGELLEQVVSSSQENIAGNSARVTWDELPVIIANRQQMIQVFQNLVNNAIKFHRDEAPRIHVAVSEEENHWKFSVSDNGIGIDKKFNERIFVLFQRLNPRDKYDGTGIGLTICKKIVEQHDGNIWVESEPGKGSVFYFTIKKQGKPMVVAGN